MLFIEAPREFINRILYATLSAQFRFHAANSSRTILVSTREPDLRVIHSCYYILYRPGRPHGLVCQRGRYMQIRSRAVSGIWGVKTSFRACYQVDLEFEHRCTEDGCNHCAVTLDVLGSVSTVWLLFPWMIDMIITVEWNHSFVIQWLKSDDFSDKNLMLYPVVSWIDCAECIFSE